MQRRADFAAFPPKREQTKQYRSFRATIFFFIQFLFGGPLFRRRLGRAVPSPCELVRARGPYQLCGGLISDRVDRIDQLSTTRSRARQCLRKCRCAVLRYTAAAVDDAGNVFFCFSHSVFLFFFIIIFFVYRAKRILFSPFRTGQGKTKGLKKMF